MIRRRKAPSVLITTRIRPEILEMVKQGAAYHGIGYQTYLQWLVENEVKQEARYYGWVTIPPTYTAKTSKVQLREVDRLMRIAKRRAKT